MFIFIRKKHIGKYAMGDYASFADFSPMCLSVREPKVRCERFLVCFFLNVDIIRRMVVLNGENKRNAPPKRSRNKLHCKRIPCR
jgi:hypothetical protein